MSTEYMRVRIEPTDDYPAWPEAKVEYTEDATEYVQALERLARAALALKHIEHDNNAAEFTTPKWRKAVNEYDSALKAVRKVMP